MKSLDGLLLNSPPLSSVDERNLLGESVIVPLPPLLAAMRVGIDPGVCCDMVDGICYLLSVRSIVLRVL